MALAASKPVSASAGSPKGPGGRTSRFLPTDAGGSSGERRIPAFVAGLMIAAAFVIDFFQFVVTAGLAWLPIIGWLAAPAVDISISIVAACLFALWFYYKEVRFLGRISALGAIVVEVLPFFNNLPGWTLGVGWTVLMSWREDRQAKHQAAGGSASEAAPALGSAEAPAPANDSVPSAANDNRPQRQSRFVDGIRGGRNNGGVVPLRKAA